MLDLVYRVECTVQIDNYCGGGFREPAHRNQSRNGKGGALNANDCFVGLGCRACHRELDQGRSFTREKAEIWQHEQGRMMLALWQMGAIQVVA